ncbi:MAG: low molecular weight phosphatase family protein [Microcoleaceae cyanobacterium]
MKRVLFLCTRNDYRSRFSECLFNDLATRKGLGWRASSRGLAINQPNDCPYDGVTRQAISSALAKRGIMLSNSLRCPIQVSEVDLKSTNRIIAIEESIHRSLMQERHPAWVNTIEYWNIKDPSDDAVEHSLNQLEQQIQQLVKQLEALEIKLVPEYML